ncbi:polyketide synthase [Apiospora marii]|uniref:Polyketide synthase n=1 Tax=Apiospora marii TaxID=335849 RepID=A0ABR1RZ51_9PEZI
MPSSTPISDVPIAVVGLACRFPGDASTATKFWDLLKSGKDAYSPTSTRWNPDGFYHPQTSRLNTIPTRGGHFLQQDPYVFDAAFFNITAAEAVALDPKQRITMEVAYEAFENAGIPEGRSKAFDESAQGYGRGEGCGILILKRLDKAIQDGDSVRAIIRATGANSDGWTQGVTMPSMDAQAALIKYVYESNGLDFASTQYVEAHGTGTKAGDPIEAEAIYRTIGQGASPKRKLWIGSVKPNIGHLEATAGVAGIIKGILALEHGLIPPNLHFTRANPAIPFEEWNMAVPTKLTPWPVARNKRMSVSGFGMGGTNGHVVLEAFDPSRFATPIGGNSAKGTMPLSLRPGRSAARSRLFVFSSHDQAGFRRNAAALIEHLDALGPAAASPEYLANLAHTLAGAKSRLAWKATCVADGVAELRDYLATRPGEGASPEGGGSHSTGPPRIGLVFTGQGAQWARMGVELLERPVFADSVAQSADILRKLGCLWDPVEELRKPEADSELGRPEMSQTICSMLQIALVDELQAGEIAAAYAAGALSRHDAVAAAYFRGVASTALRTEAPELRGGMMAVGCSRDEADEVIAQVKLDGGRANVACVNSPSSVTLSGDVAALEQLRTVFEERKIFARRLKVEMAYHSVHMNKVFGIYSAAIANLQPTIPQDARHHPVMISSVTGHQVEPELLGPYYWVRNLVSPVLFSDAVKEMVCPEADDSDASNDGTTVDLLIEVGPHSALGGPVEQILNHHGIENVNYKSMLTRGKNSLDTVLALVADLFMAGVPLDLARANGDLNARFLTDLPPYQFNHSRRFRHETRIQRELVNRQVPQKSIIGSQVPMMDETQHVWRNLLRLEDEPWVRGHMVGGTVLFPAAGFLAMRISSRSRESEDARDEQDQLSEYHRQVQECTTHCTKEEFCNQFEKTGWKYGDIFQGLDNVHLGDGKMTYDLTLFDMGETFSKGQPERPFLINVPALDAVFQACLGTTYRKGRFVFDRPLLPTYFGELEISLDFPSDPGAVLRGMSTARKQIFNEVSTNIATFDDTLSRVYLSAKDFRVSELSGDSEDQVARQAQGHPADITSETHWNYALELLKPDELGALVSAISPEKRLVELVRIYLHQNPAANVLELVPSLEALSNTSLYLLPKGTIHSSQVKYAVESKTGAAADSGTVDKNMEGEVVLLDLSETKLPDGIPPPDLVVVGQPADAFHNVEKAMAHLAQLSKPDGAVLLTIDKNMKEATDASLESKGFRLITDVVHQERLVALYKRLNPEHTNGVVKGDLTIITPRKQSSVVQSFSRSLQEALEDQGHGSSVMSWTELSAGGLNSDKLEGRTFISLLELDQPFLDEMAEEDFHHLRRLVLGCERILWLVCGDHPAMSLVDGLARTLRTEVAGTRFQILHLEGDETAARHGPVAAARILTSHTRDDEFRERNGLLQVSRIFNSHEGNEAVRSALEDSVQVQSLTGPGTPPLRLKIGGPGLLDTLTFVNDDRMEGALGEKEIEVEVKATGVNFKDIMASMGLVEVSLIGHEASGVVVNVGREASSRFQPGDRVTMLRDGMHATRIRIDHRLAVPIPDSMPFKEAAALPMVHVTAYHALVNVAKVYRADVADEASFREAMRQCEHDLPPVRGVLQMAMVLRDVVFEKMEHGAWAEPLRPKAQYAAGNTYQDALAHYRRARGLRAVAVDLGIMRDVGVLAEQGVVGQHLQLEEALGIREPAFRALIKSLIRRQQQQDGAPCPAQVTVGLGTADILAAHGLPPPDHFQNDARFGPLAILTSAGGQAASGSDPAAAATVSLSSRLAQAADREQAVAWIAEGLVAKVADILQVPASEVDPARPMYRYGVDSLVALEVRNWIAREMKANMALLEILAAVPMDVFAAKIAEKSKLVADLE